MNQILKAQIIRKYGTQYKFARALNVQETLISSVVREHRELDLARQKQWAKALNSTVQELFRQ